MGESRYNEKRLDLKDLIVEFIEYCIEIGYNADDELDDVVEEAKKS